LGSGSGGSDLILIWLRLLAAIAVVLWVWLCARRRVASALPGAPRDLAWCAATIWTATVLVGSALALGAVGALTDWSWSAVAGLGALALRPRRRLEPAAEPVAGEDTPSVPFRIALGGYLIGRGAFGLRNPPADVDSIHYHLPMVAHWLQSHALGVRAHEPAALGSYYPGNVELLQMAAAFATGSDTLMGLPSVVALGLLALALRRLGMVAGATAGVSEAMALCLAGAPGLAQLTLGIRVENLMAAWFALALLFGLRFRRDERPADLELAVLALGLFAGSKSTGPVLAAMAALAVLVGPGWRGRWRRLAQVRAALALAALLSLFWPARNAVAFGNPLYPAALSLGPWQLPGIVSRELLARTTQISVWLAGKPGHLNVDFLLQFLGPCAVLIPLGVLLHLVRRRGATDLDHALLGLGAASFLLFLVTPFSGIALIGSDGRLMTYARDNLRLLMPTAVAALPLAARGLSLHAGRWLPAAIGALFLVALGPKLGHVLPGILVMTMLLGAWPLFRDSARRRHGRVAPALIASGLLALGVVGVEPLRERASDLVWDDFLDRRSNLDAAAVRRLCREAGGRPIALVGMEASWAYFGRHFDSHPIYVPVARSWAPSPGAWRFAHDDRSRADHATWLRNLEASRTAFVVVGPAHMDCSRLPIERDWMASDPRRFVPVARRGCAEAYRVRPATGSTTSAGSVTGTSAAPPSGSTRTRSSWRQRTRHAGSGSRV
jgi:4-amino-4-deoxy-L-arabinose transferase-like glycosyltransferase